MFYYMFMDKGRRTSHSSSSDLKKPHKYFYFPGNREVSLNSTKAINYEVKQLAL